MVLSQALSVLKVWLFDQENSSVQKSCHLSGLKKDQHSPGSHVPKKYRAWRIFHLIPLAPQTGIHWQVECTGHMPWWSRLGSRQLLARCVTTTGECVDWSKLIGMRLATTAYHCTISFNLVKHRAHSLSKLKSMSMSDTWRILYLSTSLVNIVKGS